MKINANILERHVDKASLSGTILSINMDFREDGVYSCVKDMMDRTLTKTFLDKKGFEIYDPIGEVFIKNTLAFTKVLRSFSEIVEIAKTEEHILSIIAPTREADIILGAAIVCENVFRQDFPVLNTTAVAKVKKSDLEKALKDVGLLQIKEIKIKQDGTLLVLEVGQKGESDVLRNKIQVEGSGTGQIGVGDSLIGFYNALDGDFTMKIGNDLPIVLHEKSDFIDYTCIIAPIVTND